jgi:HD-GYP domain-containing protein (c-di-GMP phosphodiesterase class II)
MPLEKALSIIQKDAGSHFDPELAKLFVSMKRNGKGYKSLTAAGEIGDNQRPDVHHPPPQVS